MRFPVLALVALGMATVAAAHATAQTTAPWDYTGKRGTLEWGKLDPAYKACSAGHEQSPVDIRGAKLNKALQPIEFHFHHPSEEAVRGKLTDMDVHLLYKSADGKQAVVAVRLTEDITTPPNAVLAMLWPHLPTQTGQTEKVADMVNPGGFLPADRGYWTYMGSLTIPPCTEGVRWFIMEQDMTLSRDQLRAIAALFKVNSRPLQDLHGRRIEADE